ncbi:hypothetical protein SAMN06264849_10461 [Melghirimyces algeriensis]|uniref:Uncharacterized protein n=1 Tax=Melghirimyces algeriensis TaxID=910412 RepID=A0A521CL49_9BACL|nr:hypothetical protein SAMN06264849_10461 [Melghirimyces algeriensis]
MKFPKYQEYKNSFVYNGFEHPQLQIPTQRSFPIRYSVLQTIILYGKKPVPFYISFQ